MNNRRQKAIRTLTAIIYTTGLVAIIPSVSTATPLPEKFVFASHIGWNVNKTKVEQAGATQQEKNVCTVESQDTCQSAGSGLEAGFLAGSFSFAFGVAANRDPSSPTYGDLYVADEEDNRIKVFNGQGDFVLMLGWNVNRTKVALGGGATQAEKNVCKEEAPSECEAGEAGEGAGWLERPSSIAVDPADGDIYVLDQGLYGRPRLGQRVDEFTEDGQFVLRIGKNVNKKGTNLCVAAESAECEGAETEESGTASGAFDMKNSDGGLLAVGGPSDLLYVGDRARVQKFHSNGQWAGDTPLTGLSASGEAVSVAVDSSGNLFVADEGAPGVHEYNANNELQPQTIDATSREVRAVSVDKYGRVGLVDGVYGKLYTTTGVEISEFVPPSGEMRSSVDAGPTALAFAPSTDDLYVPETGGHEIEAYKATVVAHLEPCATESVTGTSVTLKAAVNPNGIEGTQAWLQYETIEELEANGWRAATDTPKEAFVTDSNVHQFSASVTNLVPNQEYVCRAAGEDNEFKPTFAEQPLFGEPLKFKSQALPPSVERPPEVPFVHSEAAVLKGELNPEHAATRYHFEYVTDEQFKRNGWAGAISTPDTESDLYATVAVTQEITGLIPATTYHARLTATNEYNARTEGPETTFTTSPPVTPLAVTGGHSAETATTAIVAGEVKPDGQPAVYTFELGVYEGAQTRYGVVFSGPAGEGTSFMPEELQLSGLQPGTTYAYRIKVESSYGSSTGNTEIFKTLGLPAVLEPPAIPQQLPMPPGMTFPKQPPAQCKRGFKRDKHGHCVRVRRRKSKGHTKRRKGHRRARLRRRHRR